MKISIQSALAGAPGTHRLRARVARRIKPVKPSHADELWYRGVLLEIVRQGAQAVEDELLPVLSLTMQTPGQDSARRVAADGPMSQRQLDDLFARLAQRLQTLTANAGQFAVGAAERARKNTDARLAENIRRSVGIDIRPLLGQNQSLSDAMNAAIRENVDLIKSIPDQYLERVRQATAENIAAGKRHTDIAKEIEQINGITGRRAKIIARDQVSKMNGDFNRIRQQEAGITRYVWQTSGDERVRESHAELDGKVFSWDDPPEEGHPGEAILCRCVGVPLLDIDLPPAYGEERKPEEARSHARNEPEVLKHEPKTVEFTGNELGDLNRPSREIANEAQKIAREKFAGKRLKQRTALRFG